MSTCDFILVFVIPFVYGFAKFCTDIWRDVYYANWISFYARWLELHGHSGLLKWYEGGQEYSQRVPWSIDFWHTFDNLKFWLLLFVPIVTVHTTWLIWVFPLPMLFVFGRTFTLFYHVIGRTVPTESFWTWFVNCFLFWRPENK